MVMSSGLVIVRRSEGHGRPLLQPPLVLVERVFFAPVRGAFIELCGRWLCQ